MVRTERLNLDSVPVAFALILPQKQRLKVTYIYLLTVSVWVRKRIVP